MTLDNVDKLFELFSYFKYSIKQIKEDMKILENILRKQQNHYNHKYCT